jgi:regulator of replication initiation timing
MKDPIVGKHTDGRPIYKGADGDTYILSDLPVIGPKLDKQINGNKGSKSNNNKMEESNMAGEDGLVTRAELMKRDMDTMKKDLESKIAANKEVDLEIKGKIQELDKKQCVGDECLVRMEKKQDEMFKAFADQLKALAEPRFVCKNCHSSSIRKGDTRCPTCGDAVIVDWV